MKQKNIKSNTSLSVYEKMMRLPKTIQRKLKGSSKPYEFYFRMYCFDKIGNDFHIEYVLQDCWMEHIRDKEQWDGTFDECICKAYDFFQASGELLADENSVLDEAIME